MPQHPASPPGDNHPRIFIPGSLKRGHSRARERFFWAAAPAQLHQGIHIRQKEKVGSRDDFGSSLELGTPRGLGLDTRRQSWHLQALEGLGAQKWDRGVKPV